MRVFNEVQRFKQWWLWLMLLAILSFLLYDFFTVEKSEENSIALFIGIFTIIPVVLLFVTMKLKTTINEIGVHYQFKPFQFSNRTIRWSEIEECYLRTYKPISEYGGWGLRGTSRNNKAYNVSGNKGIQIVLKTKDKILVGTQKEKDAQQIIHRYFNKGNE
ncbi:hypothetical protein JQC67_17465 [Aurantibacter crassamenti]|uniref:hypothetical protein n=1 Tax=Aurantibacter crassamenti TaxID=1837375 RepID=UPI001939B016|nr:hypothetical protein [Aurantibacter crassamenti]MBM1107948.1 hypothetical protein [Aurantibacter crassamenti]